jgi:hypothetical protein
MFRRVESSNKMLDDFERNFVDSGMVGRGANFQVTETRRSSGVILATVMKGGQTRVKSGEELHAVERLALRRRV